MSARRARAANQAAVLRVGPEMTIYQAAEIKQRLLRALQLRPELRIDLSAVTEMDSAGLQLLVMAKKEAARRGLELRLVAHSKATLEVLDTFNLAAYFGDPVVISSDKPTGRAPEAQ